MAPQDQGDRLSDDALASWLSSRRRRRGAEDVVREEVDEEERRRLEKVAVQNAERRARVSVERSRKGGSPLAPVEPPAPGTATVRAGPPMPVETDYGRSRIPVGLEKAMPITGAIPADYEQGEAVRPARKLSVVERVMGGPGRMLERAAVAPFRAATSATDLGGRAVGFVGDMAVDMAKEHPIETAMFSNPWTAPGAALSLGVQGALSGGRKLRAMVEDRPMADAEPDEFGVTPVPTMGDIAPDLLMMGFAGLEAGRFAGQMMKGKGVVDRVIAQHSKAAAQDFAMGKRFEQAQARQGREKAAYPLLEQEKEAAELASAQRASRQREPKLLTSGPIITPPPGKGEGPADAITRVLRGFQKGRGEAPPIRGPFEEAEVISVETVPKGAPTSDAAPAVEYITLRDERGFARRNLAKVNPDELDAEELRLLEKIGSAESLLAHQDELNWRNAMELPDMEKTGNSRRKVDLHGNPIKRRRPEDDMPDADGMYDHDDFEQRRKNEREYNKGRMAREAEEKLLKRIQAQKAENARRNQPPEDPTDFDPSRMGAARPDLMLPVGGAAAGGAAGGMVGDTPEERQRNMALGAAAGMGLGAITARVLGRAPSIAPAGGVTRGQRGGYVGEPTYVVGARPFPKPIPKTELERLGATERRVQDSKKGPIRIPPKPGTMSPVLQGEEAVRAAGVSADPLAKVRTARVAESKPESGLQNRTGAAGDLEKVGGSKSPMMREERKRPAVEHAQPSVADEERRAAVKAAEDDVRHVGFRSWQQMTPVERERVINDNMPSVRRARRDWEAARHPNADPTWYDLPDADKVPAIRAAAAKLEEEAKALPSPFSGRLYSRVARSINDAPFDKGTAEQWKAALSKGASKGERDWTGVDKFLGENAGKVLTREEVAQAHNAGRIELGEEVYGGSDKVASAAGAARETAHRAHLTARRKLDAALYDAVGEPVETSSLVRALEEDPSASLEDALKSVSVVGEEHAKKIASSEGAMKALAEWRSRAEDMRRAQDDFRKVKGNKARYEYLTEPGGENYREVVVTMRPRKGAPVDPVKVDDEAKSLFYLERPGGHWNELTDEGMESWRNAARDAMKGGVFTHSHWPGVDNPIAHVRMKDRKLPSGEKALFVEEIQSDWHQKGRKDGYRPKDPTPEDAKRFFGIRDEDWEKMDELARNSYVKEMTSGEPHVRRSGVPDAPFKKTPEWVNLGLVRAIDEAVETGADRVVWTTGKQQARRNSASLVLDDVEWSPLEAGDRRVSLGLNSDGGGEIILHVKPDGRIDTDKSDLINGIGETLEETVGKELAEKIMGGGEKGKLSGLDLEVGGDGFKTFYDEIIPKAVREYGKRMGVDIAVEPIETGIALKVRADAVEDAAEEYRNGFGGRETRSQRTREIAEGLESIAGDLTNSPERPWRMAFEEIENDYSKSIAAEIRRNMEALEEEATKAAAKEPNLSFKITPELRAKIKKEGQPMGFIAPELLAAMGGGAAGSLTIDKDDTTAEKIAKVVGGGVAGVAGVKAVKAMGKKSVTVKDGKVVADVVDDAKPLVSTVKGKTEDAKLFNKSLQVLDPQGMELWKNEEVRLIKAGEKKRVVTDADIRKLAVTTDIDQITKQDADRFNTVELFALGNRIKEDRQAYASLMDTMEKGGANLSKEDWTKLQGDMDTVLGRLLAYDKQLNRAGSETGRALRILGRIAARKGAPEDAWNVARRAIGTRELGDDITKRLAAVMNNSKLSVKERQQMIAKIISEYVDKGPIAAILDIRRWGMLSAPATHAVNLTGNIAEAASSMIITPIAAGIDRMVAAAKGGERSISMTGRGQGYSEGLAKSVKKIDKSYFEGINPDDPLNTLNLQRPDYVRSLGLAVDKAGNPASMAAKVARRLQRAGDIVYGVMGVFDAPFYQAQLRSSLMERAGLRAEREGLKGGSDAFKKRVVDLMKPDNISEVDLTMAEIEAMDATFKTPTGISAAMRLLEQKSPVAGTVARWVVPFPNTPTNLVRKALEATPGVGTVLTEIQARQLKKQLKSLGASKEEITRELQRKRVTNVAKQFATGAGLTALGYTWTKMGMLTGDYVAPMSRDEQERDESAMQKLTGQGPLTLKIGDTAHSLSSFAQFAPLLALGHALALADEESTADPRNQVPIGAKALNIADRTVTSTIRTVKDFPLMQGVENLSKLADEGLGKYAGREAASLIPFSSAVATTGRVMDDISRRPPKTGGEAIKERLPVARESIPPDVTPLGKTQGRPHAAAAVFSPTRPTKLITGEVEDEFKRLKVFPGMPKKTGGESRAAYAERMQAEGGELNTVLKKVIASPDYSQWPPPEWVQRAVENNKVWADPSDKRTPQEKAKVALLEYMVRYVRTEQTKRRKGEAP